MTITTLEIYKGDTYCLVVDGDKRTYINREIVDKFSLKKGMEIDRETFTRILYSSELRRARRRAMYLINEREYSYIGLFEKLRSNYPEDICYKVVNHMVKLGYVNDKRYAGELVYHYMECKLYGPKRVRQELYKRGIRGRIAEEAIEAAMDGMEERLRRLAEEKCLKYLNDPSDKNAVGKAKSALLRAGYDYDDINHALKNYID